MKIKQTIIFLLIFTLPFSAFCSDKNYKKLSELEGGKVFAVPTGTVADQFVLRRIPDAKIVWYNSIYDCAMAVSHGKADAAVYDKPVLLNLASKTGGMIVLDELLEPDRYGFAVRKESTDLKQAIDILLKEMKANGEYEAMMNRWMPAKGEPGPMPDFPVNSSTGDLVFGTAAVSEPMSYVDQNQNISGFDLELAHKLAQKLNKNLKVVNMEFGAMLPSLLSGKVDMVGAGLSITAERAKSVLFSDAYLEGGIAVLVKSSDTAPPIETAGKPESSWKTMGVLTGSVHEVYAKKNYPDIQILTFNMRSDMLLALDSEKLDAAIMDEISTPEVFASNPSLTTLKKNVIKIDIAAGFREDADELRMKFNQFLNEIKSNGIYEQMDYRWTNQADAKMPEFTFPTNAEAFRIGIVSDIGLPFAVKSNNEWKGFDAELSMRFASFLGKKPVMIDMPFGSLLPSMVSGKIDIITASMMVTEEREKSIDFSDPYYVSGVSIIGKKRNSNNDNSTKLAVLDDIKDKKVGIFTGTVHDAFMQKKFPEAVVSRFENTADMIMSLKSGKVDAAMFDKITANLVLKRNPDLGLLTDEVLDMPLGVGFKKENIALLNEFNGFLNEIRSDGTYAKMHKRWFEEDAELAVMPEFPDNPDGKPLVVGVSVEDLPYVALMNGKFVGFDIEMIRTFADRRNYNLELVNIEFPALVAALSSGKVDMITDGIAISEERSKQINFSDEYAVFRTSVISLRTNLTKYKDEKQTIVTKSFLTKLSESFHNNILREKRYLMILRGLLLTIVISILAATTGTLLGGLICFMRMSRNKLMNKVASYYISLVRGTPVLVLLMIIYYVVFASVNINAVLVAIIAFGINFAAYVSEMFRSGIESIDKGQKEAGIASGFTKIQTFRYIIMPQALRQVLPVYKGEFVSLVKMTSIVGYIAVEDLTKASDIIRSRTFDAFFPLIMAAVIYILISWLLTLILDYVEISVDPKKRRISQRKEELK
jgi:polar amino acid transport system substrate-binding protein